MISGARFVINLWTWKVFKLRYSTAVSDFAWSVDSVIALNCVLSRTDHPVVKLLRKHQYRVYNRLYPIVSKGLPKSPAMPLRPRHSIHNPLHPGKRLVWKTVGSYLCSPGFFFVLPSFNFVNEI